MTQNRILACSAVMLVSVFAFAPRGLAQTPLPPGTVSNVVITNPGQSNQGQCPSGVGFYPTLTCYTATIGCPSQSTVANMNFTFGYANPTGTVKGTIVILGSGGGTCLGFSSEERTGSFAQDYLGAGYRLVEAVWSTPWENTDSSGTFGTNIGYAACRPAGFLSYVRQQTSNPTLFTAGTGMCAHAASAGSAAIVFTLAWYGAGAATGGYLDKAELLSGPVFGDVEQGARCLPIRPSACSR